MAKLLMLLDLTSAVRHENNMEIWRYGDNISHFMHQQANGRSKALVTYKM